MITPALYDESDRFTNRLYDGVPRYGTNWALGEVGKKVQEFGKVYNVPVLDLYKASNEYSDRIREEYPKATTVITGNDGIHPSTEGGYLFGYLYARAQETNPVIATVEIDASNSNLKSDNAEVSNVNATASGVSYTYKPKSLPMAVVDRYNYIKNYGVDITNHMNREIIKVANLEEGTYTISMDGAEVGKFTAQQLANGVNIAEFANNPNQVVSKQLYNAIYEKYEAESALRSNIMVEHSIRSHTKYKPAGEYDYDNLTTQQWIELAKAIKENQKADPNVSEANKNDINQPFYGLVNYYNKNKAEHQNYINSTKGAIENIKTFKPVECTVIISK